MGEAGDAAYSGDRGASNRSPLRLICLQDSVKELLAA